ncbi:MAG: Mur ligase family protein, partial [Pseudomonadota bacterium]
MKLSVLIGRPMEPDPEIAGIASDSRDVKPGFLFAALPGERVNGVDYIPQAEKNGAVALLAGAAANSVLPVVVESDPRRALAMAAARFYGAGPPFVAGVTGTNGKTSTAQFAAQLLKRLGANAGVIGTLGASASGYHRASPWTTPEPIALHGMLSEMASVGVTHAIMEVSSHALAQARADGVPFRVAAFTNITQDHLDFHGTVEAYF